MARIAGIEISNDKRIDIGLTAVYGIGRVRAKEILDLVDVVPGKRTKELSAEEISRLQKKVEEFMVEGDLRQSIRQDINRLKNTNSYRGMRHNQGLPARGQRTKSNARTKRGKRKTIGALKKEDAAKVAEAKN